MKRLLTTLTATTILVADFLVLLVALFWLLFPYKTADIKVPIEILNPNKSVNVGETLQMKMILDKYANVPVEVFIQISCTDGNLAAITAKGVPRPIGHHEFVNDAYQIPPKFLDGSRCKLSFKNYYKVNPIRTIAKEWTTEEFRIMNKEAL